MEPTPPSSSFEGLTIDDDDDEDRWWSSSWESMEEADNFVDSCQLVWSNNLIISKIFSFLPPTELKTCRFVSHHWNKIALSRGHLGTTNQIKIGPGNVDDFLQFVKKTDQPFCRRFDFCEIEWDFNRVAGFKKTFKHALNSLSLSYCKALKAHSIMKLMMCPNMQELKISGDLFRSVVDVDNLFMRQEKLVRLQRLELISSQEFGQVGQRVIQQLLMHSPQLQTVFIKRSHSLWRSFVEAANAVPNSGFRTIEVSEMDNRIEMDMFDQMNSKLKELQRCKFENCIVGPEFLQAFLTMFQQSLIDLRISGTQDEILTFALTDLHLTRMVYLALPVDGIGSRDGQSILQCMPNLKTLEVSGLFRTVYEFVCGKLLSVSCQEYETPATCRMPDSPQTNAYMTAEKCREFAKIVTLLPIKIKRFTSSLLRFNSRCLRSIYRNHPELEELVLLNCSKDCTEAWTGISHPVCKKIANRRSFAVVDVKKVQLLPSLGALKNLKHLEISILGDPPKAEVTLVYVLFGICQLKSLEVLKLSNVTISDVVFLALSKTLNLSACYIDGSVELWNQFIEESRSVKIRSFLLPPGFCEDSGATLLSPLQERTILNKVISYLKPSEMFPLRLVSKAWYASVTDRLHSACSLPIECEEMTEASGSKLSSMRDPPAQGEALVNQKFSDLCSALKVLEEYPSVTKLVIRTMNQYLLVCSDRIFCTSLRSKRRNCRQLRKVFYWYFPHGSCAFRQQVVKNGPLPTTMVVLGCWTKKDTGLLEFLNPNFHIKSIELIGLLPEVYDLLLPKLTAMQKVDSISIKPHNGNSTSDLARHHLQILSSASFGLRSLSMQKLQAPPDAVAELIRRHRFTLETIEIQNFVNVSDRLSFAIPNLRILQLDEPPGTLLWSTLNINQNIETIRVERTGYNFKQTKSNAIPSCDSGSEEFEHSATEVLCDVNLFLEYVANKRAGPQKSVLQAGTDSALKFVSHFRYLTSLTIRGVHAHYGILQGIFKNLPQLEKLILASFAGCTDEILTGIPKETLEKMDLLNPLQLKTSQDTFKLETSRTSLRNMKHLVHLNLDDQLPCSDLSILFGVIKLKKLKYFSCRKWRITDVGIRLLTDFLPLETLILDETSPISNYGLKYFSNNTSGKCVVYKLDAKVTGLNS